MIIIQARPPNFEKIAAEFPQAFRSDVMFCYGDKIYFPSGARISDSIMAHEKVHSDRQGNNPEAWWDQYIADIKFRFDEELLAHKKEYQVECGELTRNQRRIALRQIAQRLSSKLYGSMVSIDEAKRLLLS